MTVNYNPESLCSTLFRCDGSVLPKVFWRALVAFLIGLALQLTFFFSCNPSSPISGATDSYWSTKVIQCTTEAPYLTAFLGPNIDMHVYIGVVVGLLLVFRTNISYSRYDTGVTMVGRFRTSVRNLMMQCSCYIDGLNPDLTRNPREIELRDEIRELMTLMLITVQFHVGPDRQSDSEPLTSLRTIPNIEMLCGENNVDHDLKVAYDLFQAGHRGDESAACDITPEQFRDRERLKAVDFLDGDVAEPIRSHGGGACSFCGSDGAREEPEEGELKLRAAHHNRPMLVAHWIRKRLLEAHTLEMITGNMLSAMDVSITTMMDAFEGLNRIGLLPMPFPYAQITKWCIVLYVYVSPLGFVGTMQWATPIAAFILGMICFGIDEIGVELEDPLGNDRNDMEMWEVIKRLDKELALLCVMNPGTDEPFDLLDFTEMDAHVGDDKYESTVPFVRAGVIEKQSDIRRQQLVTPTLTPRTDSASGAEDVGTQRAGAGSGADTQRASSDFASSADGSSSSSGSGSVLRMGGGGKKKSGWSGLIGGDRDNLLAVPLINAASGTQ